MLHEAMHAWEITMMITSIAGKKFYSLLLWSEKSDEELVRTGVDSGGWMDRYLERWRGEGTEWGKNGGRGGGKETGEEFVCFHSWSSMVVHDPRRKIWPCIFELCRWKLPFCLNPLLQVLQMNWGSLPHSTIWWRVRLLLFLYALSHLSHGNGFGDEYLFLEQEPAIREVEIFQLFDLILSRKQKF